MTTNPVLFCSYWSADKLTMYYLKNLIENTPTKSLITNRFIMKPAVKNSTLILLWYLKSGTSV